MNWKDELIKEYISTLSYNLNGIRKLQQQDRINPGILNLHLTYARQLSTIVGKYKEIESFIDDDILHQTKEQFLEDMNYLNLGKINEMD